jgi:predicted nucleic acid-binding protein
MTSTLVDTNIIIDLLGPVSQSRNWSAKALKKCLSEGALILSPVVWSELAASPLTEFQLVHALAWLEMKRESFGHETAFSAGKAHRKYRMAGGLRERTLPDFLIGAQAETKGHRLLTRDGARYRSYFPSINIITPETHP